jgi:predicted small integral membrane protein
MAESTTRSIRVGVITDITGPLSFLGIANANVAKRTSKALLTWAAGFFAALVVFNNLTDYDSNYMFVSHVLKMDTTFPGNRAMWRAIDSPLLYHASYWFIILAEGVIAVLCWVGGLRLFRSLRDAARFNQSKGVAIVGLTLGIILWFTGFITVGGEWFLMWQATVWNGQEAAFRLVVILGIVLLHLVHPDGQGDS